VSARSLVSLVAPLVALGALVLYLLRGGAAFVGAPPAPIEELFFERTLLRPEEVTLRIRNTGPTPVSIGQVLVNEAIWDFSIRPGRVVRRLGAATMTIAYPWEEGQPLEVALVSSNGIKFVKEIEVAHETPQPSGRAFLYFGLLGLYAGVIPVFLGLLWFPFLKSLGASAVHFLLSLTAGLLVFLGAETLEEAFEVAGRVPSVYQGLALVLLGVAGTVIALAATGARRPRGASPASASGPADPGPGDDDAPRRLSFLIALGIGLHNLGEGLAIGAAYLLGEAALGAFLLVGFTLHNMTEGLAILAPLVRTRPSISRLVLLGAVAGAPTILGTWIGGFVGSDVASLLFLAVGAGAILQVVFQIFRFQSRDGGFVLALTRPAGVAGLAAGFLLMYGTGLLVSL
jgi:zinc transporter ZupT